MYEYPPKQTCIASYHGQYVIPGWNEIVNEKIYNGKSCIYGVDLCWETPARPRVPSNAKKHAQPSN